MQMKKFILTISAVVILLTGCSTSSPANVAGCYVATLQKDRYLLDITSHNGETIEAAVAFKNYEKDSSIGTLVGTFDGEILFGVYTFQSEGMTSRRELTFKYDDGGWYSGYGPVEVNGDFESLVRPLDITWDTSYKYLSQKVCE
jgi:hypothetical protein